MDITGESGDEVDVLDMVVVFEDALIEMRDTPAERNVIHEQFRQCRCCLGSIGVAPCAERNENLLLLVECHIAMHHG